jgi:hypothetical protein
LAATSLTEVEKNRKSLALIIATVQEQGLTDLKHKISVTGTGTVSADKTKVYVDNTVFIINKDTIISTTEGDTVATADLPAKTEVTIVGSKEINSIIAKVVTVTIPTQADTTKDNGEIKGATITKPTVGNNEPKPIIVPTKKVTPPVILTPPIPIAPEPTQEEDNKKANEVTAGYIADSPSAQYEP